MRHNHLPIIIVPLIVGVACVYSCLAAGPASGPTSQPVSNAQNTFSVMIGKAWTRTDKNASGDGDQMEIRIDREGRVFADIYVYRVGLPGDVDATAKYYVDQAKKELPDLNKDCAVERVKVGESDARLVKCRRRGSHDMEYFIVRGDRLYRIKCMARDSALDEMQQQIKDVMDTFSWTERK